MWEPLWELLKFFGGWAIGHAMDEAMEDQLHGGGTSPTGGGGGGGLPGGGQNGGW